MGENVERLGRLRSNRGSIAGLAIRTAQSVQRTVATTTVEVVATGVQKAARTEGFEGEFGTTVAESLTKIRKDLDRFADYQGALNKAIELANEEMQNTSNGVEGLPDSGLTSGQQATIDIATATNSPVTVQPGVTMTPAAAQQYYLDQAAVAQEEQAAKLTAALDSRLQEIIDGLPESKYDPPKPPEDPTDGEDPSGHTRVNGGGTTGGNNTGTGIGFAGIVPVKPPTHEVTPIEPVDPPIKHPIVVPPPPVHPPVDPPVHPPVYPPVTPPPNIDGITDGTIPGGGTGGSGSVGGGLSGSVGGGGSAGVVGGAAGLAARLGGDGRLVGNAGGAAGAGMAPGAGATGVVAQGGAAGGGRGGAMVGGAAGGAGGAGGRGDKRRRRRGQDLMAFQVEPEDEQIPSDLGAAGAAGRSSSDGREELGW